jgi:hypothetical protein
MILFYIHFQRQTIMPFKSYAPGYLRSKLLRNYVVFGSVLTTILKYQDKPSEILTEQESLCEISGYAKHDQAINICWLWA